MTKKLLIDTSAYHSHATFGDAHVHVQIVLISGYLNINEAMVDRFTQHNAYKSSRSWINLFKTSRKILSTISTIFPRYWLVQSRKIKKWNSSSDFLLQNSVILRTVQYMFVPYSTLNARIYSVFTVYCSIHSTKKNWSILSTVLRMSML